jgi:hypothetical protein
MDSKTDGNVRFMQHFGWKSYVAELPIYFDNPSSYTIDETGAKFVRKTSGNEKMQLTVAGNRDLPPHVILNLITMPKVQLPMGLSDVSARGD